MTRSSPNEDRTRLRRLPERAVFDQEQIEAIVDEALICHVAFVHDDYPVVIPTIHARNGDVLYIHGSPAGRMLRDLKRGAQVCVNITIVDGLVMARAPFHSSMNYRSVVIFGEARFVAEPDEKWEALRLITEHVAPGRWDDSRLPNDKEMRATSVLALPMDEASAKVRTGPPDDDEADYELPLWAGVVPLQLVSGEPVDDPDLRVDVAVPDYLTHYRRP